MKKYTQLVSNILLFLVFGMILAVVIIISINLDPITDLVKQVNNGLSLFNSLELDAKLEQLNEINEKIDQMNQASN